MGTPLRGPPAPRAPEAPAGEADYEARLAALRTEYEAKLADLKARYPWIIARRLADGLLRAGNGAEALASLLEKVDALPVPLPVWRISAVRTQPGPGLGGLEPLPLISIWASA